MYKILQASCCLGLVTLVVVLSGCAPGVDDGASTASKDQLDADIEQSELEMTPIVPPAADVVPDLGAESNAVTSLGIGDAAPPLAISKWMLGEPIQPFEPGQVYVIEFWATWCGPCLQGMPHMSEIQESYGDTVKIVGITREEPGVVASFLGREQSEGVTWQEIIKYRLAVDQDDVTNNAYMRAARQNGIPTAFIVGKQGVVEWIGHPMRMEEPLEKVVNDSWDRKAAVAQLEAQQRLSAMSAKLASLQRAQKWDEALAVLDEVGQELGQTAPFLMTKMQLLTLAGRVSEVTAIREQLIELSWDNAMQLNEIAWNTAISDPSPEELGFALKAAERAAELTEHTNGAILDTLARVYYEQGDLDKAIMWQKKAVEHADGQRAISTTLKKYEAEKEGK